MIQAVGGGACEYAFLTSSQVLMQLVQVLLVSHRCKGGTAAEPGPAHREEVTPFRRLTHTDSV